MANIIIEILEGGDPRPNPTVHPTRGHGDLSGGGHPGRLGDLRHALLPHRLHAPHAGREQLAHGLVLTPGGLLHSPRRRTYTYSVEVLGQRVTRRSWAGTEAKQGELDVTTDPPKDKEKR